MGMGMAIVVATTAITGMTSNTTAATMATAEIAMAGAAAERDHMARKRWA